MNNREPTESEIAALIQTKNCTRNVAVDFLRMEIARENMGIDFEKMVPDHLKRVEIPPSRPQTYTDEA